MIGWPRSLGLGGLSGNDWAVVCTAYAAPLTPLHLHLPGNSAPQFLSEAQFPSLQKEVMIAPTS